MSGPRPDPFPGWFLPALAAATVLVAWPLLLPSTYETHDGHYALYNAAQFDRALRDGQLPVRWLPDLHGGRGLPVFLFLHPLAFYAVSLLHGVGLGFIAAVKTLYLVSLPLSGLAMTVWLRSTLPGAAAAIGALAYVLAPFRVVEVHVKGDPPAALAYVFIPLVLLGIDRAAAGRKRGTVLLALASAGLVLSHSVTALLVVPAAIGYAALALPRPAATAAAAAARILAGCTLGALLAAFHWIPALVEKRYVLVDSPQGILFFDFRDHFVAAWQWLSPLWGYHGSFAGTRDDMAFQVGPIHAAALLAGATAWLGLDPGRSRRLGAWATCVTVAALLGMLAISRPVWELVPLLAYVQFPWRLLTLLAATSAVLLAIAAARLDAYRLLAVAAMAAPLITFAFAAAQRNVWYTMVGLAYVLAGAIVWASASWGGRRGEHSLPAVAVLLLTTALPWSAVPLHARFKGEPRVVSIHESDLAPQRVQLGVRRTTARFDYLPRTVLRVPALDPAQEFLPPRDARPAAPLVVLSGDLDVIRLSRRSDRWTLRYRSAHGAGVALNLHAFPGWTATLDLPVREGHARNGQGGDLRGTGIGKALALHSDALGRIVLASGRRTPEATLLPPGEHTVVVRFERTPVRRVGDGLTVAGLLVLGGALATPMMARARARREPDR